MLWSCPHCQKKMKVAPSLLGKRGKCPHCQQVIDFPETGPKIAAALSVEDERPWTPRRLKDLGVAAVGAALVHLVVLFLFLVLAGAPAPGKPVAEDYYVPALPVVEAPLILEKPREFEPPKEEEVPPLDPPIVGLPEPIPILPEPIPIPIPIPIPGPGVPLPISGPVRFLGSSGSGSHVCIIADRSSSMGGAKLEFTKVKLMDTIRSLPPGTRFFVVFFGDEAEAQPGGQWLTAPRDNAKLANWVESITAGGGTEPGPAFKLALGLKRRPDLIFFLTDGVFNPEYVKEIKLMNQPRGAGKRVTINTIALLDRAGEKLLQQIAEANGGAYTFVSKLRRE